MHPAEFGKQQDGKYPNADKLPDAEQISPLFAGCYSGNGIFSYPRVGSVVRCGFWNNDQNLPWYDGACLGGEEALSSFNEARCMPSKSPDDAYIHIIYAKNTTVMINEEGALSVSTKNAKLSCMIALDSDGNILLESSESINLHAKNINLSADIGITEQSGDSKVMIQPNSYKVDSKCADVVGSNGVLVKSDKSKRSW